MQSVIFNLSAHQLTAAEETLLNKGLSFIPSVSSTKFSHVIDNYKLTRHICLKERFGDRGINGEIPGGQDGAYGGVPQDTGVEIEPQCKASDSLECIFKNKSDFDPISSNASIKTFHRLLNNDMFKLHSNREKKRRGNLTLMEREAIKSLKENKDIGGTG